MTARTPALIYVKPLEGRTIYIPSPSRPLQIMPADGMPVAEHDPHWQALLKFGDIETAQPPAPEPAALEPAPKPEHEPAAPEPASSQA